MEHDETQGTFPPDGKFDTNPALPPFRTEEFAANGNFGAARMGRMIGIISLFFWLIPILGFPLALCGLLLGLTAREEGNAKKRARTAIILSAIGLTLATINGALNIFLYTR